VSHKNGVPKNGVPKNGVPKNGVYTNGPGLRPDIPAEIRGGDPNQSMDDEVEIGASTLAQAVFWTGVYSEILAMETDVLSRVHELMALQSPRVRREVEQSNIPVIVAQLSRFAHRHSVWQDRVAELQATA
jgi:hypothetical protein